jgi:hypothetical protein
MAVDTIFVANFLRQSQHGASDWPWLLDLLVSDPWSF